MNKLKKINNFLKLSNENLIVIIIALFFTIINSLQVFIQFFANKPGEYFTWINHFFADYFLYTYHIAEGINGHIYSGFAFTNEPIRKTWLYWLNSLLGIIGGKFGLNPFEIYNFSLIILVFILILFWHRLLKIIIPNNKWMRILSLLIILTASPFINILELLKNGSIIFPDKLWFSPAPSFWRLGGVPHQVFQSLLIICFIMQFVKLVSSGGLKNYIFTGLLSFILMTAQPMQAMSLLTGSGILTIKIFINKKYNLKVFVPLIIIFVSSLPAALITNNEFQLAPFAVGKIWESSQQVPTDFMHFIYTHGPIIILLPFGIWGFIKKANNTSILLFAYTSAANFYYLSPIPRFIGATAIRFLNPVEYNVLCIISVYGIYYLAFIFSKIIRTQNIKFTYNLTIFVILIILATFTIPANFKQITDRINPVSNSLLLMDTYYNHVPLEYVEAFNAIKVDTALNDRIVVLSDDLLRLDILIPTFTLKKSFLGHPVLTLYPDVKESLRSKFFAGLMLESEVNNFLNNHYIGYVITGSINDKTNEASRKYLKIIFENSITRVYKVI